MNFAVSAFVIPNTLPEIYSTSNLAQIQYAQRDLLVLIELSHYSIWLNNLWNILTLASIDYVQSSHHPISKSIKALLIAFLKVNFKWFVMMNGYPFRGNFCQTCYCTFQISKIGRFMKRSTNPNPNHIVSITNSYMYYCYITFFLQILLVEFYFISFIIFLKRDCNEYRRAHNRQKVIINFQRAFFCCKNQTIKHTQCRAGRRQLFPF